jgi:hypothetical protein
VRHQVAGNGRDALFSFQDVTAGTVFLFDGGQFFLAPVNGDTFSEFSRSVEIFEKGSVTPLEVYSILTLCITCTDSFPSLEEIRIKLKSSIYPKLHIVKSLYHEETKTDQQENTYVGTCDGCGALLCPNIIIITLEKIIGKIEWNALHDRAEQLVDYAEAICMYCHNCGPKMDNDKIMTLLLVRN